MDIEEYFAPAVELGYLLHNLNCAAEKEKPIISEKINNCTYLVRLRLLQSLKFYIQTAVHLARLFV